MPGAKDVARASEKFMSGLPDFSLSQDIACSPSTKDMLLPFFTILLILGLEHATVLAQTPVVQEKASASLFQRDTIAGDWGGIRSTLQNFGIDISVTNFGDTIGVPEGGTRNLTTYSNLLQSEVEVDLDKLIGWPNGRLFFLGGGTWGADPGDSATAISNPSNLAAPDSFRVLEAWLEQSFFEEQLALLLGIYSVDAEFDAKETADVFMNSGFGTGLDLSETGGNGPCAFPFTCLGVRVKFQPNESFYFQTALTDGVAGDPDDPHGNKFILDSNDGVFSISELGFNFSERMERFFRVALGGWFYTTEFDDQLEMDDSGNPLRRDGTHGIYGFAEAELFSETEDPTQGLSSYIRAGWADEDVNQIEYYLGGAFVYTGLFPTRDLDVMGFGISVGFNGDKFKTVQRQAGSPVRNQEVALEWTYRAQIFPWLAVQPDVQYIINPATDPSIDNVLVAGFRYESVF